MVFYSRSLETLHLLEASASSSFLLGPWLWPCSPPSFLLHSSSGTVPSLSWFLPLSSPRPQIPHSGYIASCVSSSDFLAAYLLWLFPALWSQALACLVGESMQSLALGRVCQLMTHALHSSFSHGQNIILSAKDFHHDYQKMEMFISLFTLVSTPETMSY